MIDKYSLHMLVDVRSVDSASCWQCMLSLLLASLLSHLRVQEGLIRVNINNSIVLITDKVDL